MLCEASQRLMHLLNGGRTDRPPLWEPWFAMGEFSKRRYGGNDVHAYLRMAEELGHAAVGISSPNTDVMFLTPHDRTEAGAYYAGGQLRTVEQLRDRPEPDYESQLEKIAAERRAAAAAGRACWLVIGWCFDRVAASMGLEHFAMTCYDSPEFMHEAMGWVERRNRNAIEKIVRHVRPDFVLYNGDCAYKTGPMIDPAMIRDFCFEPTRRTVEMIRDLDIPFAFHTDGKLDEIVPILLDLGIRAVHGCEKQANDLSHLVSRFGQDIALCGNMDVVFLKDATVEQVRIETYEMLRTGGAAGRFIAGCNTSPMNYIPDENYMAFCGAVAEYDPSA
ncbi:MAG: uroporphyrinogen decarboxylase family protein [Phycisphaerales bacterium]